MERIEKILSKNTSYSRGDIKKLIREKRIKLNNEVVTEIGVKVDYLKDKIEIDDEEIILKEKIYLCLNKPKGYVSATKDLKEATVLDLVDEKYRKRNLFPAGRLDKDTTGLIILTDDGEFAHDILSPKKHVEKTYLVEIDVPLTKEMENGFFRGVELNDGVCLSAKLEKIDEFHARVVLKEGRYHQIKRMFLTYNAKVVELKRIGIGKYFLPKDLKEGDFLELSSTDILKIKERT